MNQALAQSIANGIANGIGTVMAQNQVELIGEIRAVKAAVQAMPQAQQAQPPIVRISQDSAGTCTGRDDCACPCAKRANYYEGRQVKFSKDAKGQWQVTDWKGKTFHVVDPDYVDEYLERQGIRRASTRTASVVNAVVESPVVSYQAPVRYQAPMPVTSYTGGLSAMDFGAPITTAPASVGVSYGSFSSGGLFGRGGFLGLGGGVSACGPGGCF
jgi:hypothetical protein